MIRDVCVCVCVCVWRNWQQKNKLWNLLFPVYCNPWLGQSRELISIYQNVCFATFEYTAFKNTKCASESSFLLIKQHLVWKPDSLLFYKYKGLVGKEKNTL